MGWRPEENWEENKKSIIDEVGTLPPQTEFPIVIPDSFDWTLLKSRIYEAGADAMLEALKKEGRYWGMIVENPTFVTNQTGWLVFIPEEDK